MTSSFLGVVLAGISYDPEIRGVLVVVVSGAILCGSVYLLLATNIGARLGFQVALTGKRGQILDQCSKHPARHQRGPIEAGRCCP